MNQFNKEELLHIFDSVNTDAKYYGNDHIAHPILKKLETMIDNYCEHPFVVPNFSIVKECVECKKYVSHTLMSKSKDAVQYE